MQIGPAINLTQVLTGSLPGISVSSQTFDAFPHIYENSCNSIYVIHPLPDQLR